MTPECRSMRALRLATRLDRVVANVKKNTGWRWRMMGLTCPAKYRELLQLLADWLKEVIQQASQFLEHGLLWNSDDHAVLHAHLWRAERVYRELKERLQA